VLLKVECVWDRHTERCLKRQSMNVIRRLAAFPASVCTVARSGARNIDVAPNSFLTGACFGSHRRSLKDTVL
jgi:hypothetical protein